MEKIKVKSVEIERQEGKIEYCGKKAILPDFNAVRKWLWSQASTYPEHGGYDKHHFKVTFEDGHEHEGRLDCKHYNCEGNDLDLREHLNYYFRIYSGNLKPVWFKDSHWEVFCMENKRSGVKAYCDEMLEKYEI